MVKRPPKQPTEITLMPTTIQRIPTQYPQTGHPAFPAMPPRVVGGLPMQTANRVYGPAPLSVFFDAIDAVPGMNTTGVFQPPAWPGTSVRDIAAIDYVWTFGETVSPGIDNWTHSGKSKNVAFGAIAQHTFETPGTYSVDLMMWNSFGFPVQYRQTVTVTNPESPPASGGFSGVTYYVDPAAVNDAGDGLTTGTAWKTLVRAINRSAAGGGANSLFGSDGPRRILLKAGVTHTVAADLGYETSAVLAGPFHIGRYGVGSNPLIDFTNSGDSFNLWTSVSNLTIVDVDMRGHASTGTLLSEFGRYGLYLRGTLSGPQTIFGSSGAGTPAYNAPCIQECTFNSFGAASGGSVYGFGLFTSPGAELAKNCAIMGCTFAAGSANHRHTIGRSYYGRSVYQHNLFNIDTQDLGVKIVQSRGDLVEFVIVSDNTFVNGCNDFALRVEYESGDAWTGGVMRNVIAERNKFSVFTGGNNQRFIKCESPFITVRNNTADLTGDTGSGVFFNFRRGIEHLTPLPPAPDHARVENNTLYRSDTRATMALVSSDGGSAAPAAPPSCKNNLLYGPNVTSVTVGSTDASGDLIGNPSFVNAGTGDFHLSAGSPAATGAVESMARWDADNILRPKYPQIPKRARGAYEDT